jgi:mono/diheme cytochrome c family protein
MFIYNIVKHGHIQHPGKTTYQRECAQCHGDNGEGIKSLIPPLLESDFARNNFDSIPCWLKNGLARPITVNGKQYDQPMYGQKMDNIETANVINYINMEFLRTERQINAEWVTQRWSECGK